MMEVETIIQSVAPFSRFEHAFVGCAYMICCLVGASLNLLTAVTFYKDSRLLPSSKPWLHIALALANVGVVGPSPFPASSSFSGKWLYGSTLCQFYAFEGMFIGIAAIGFVVAMCIERYVIGSRPNSDKSGWFYLSAIILTLGNALFWAVMPLLGWSRYSIDATGTTCALDYNNPDEGFVSYLLTLEMFSFGIPLLAAAFCLYWSAPVQGSSTSGNDPAVAGTSSSGGGQSSSEQSSSPVIVVADQNMDGFAEGQLKTLCLVFLFLVLVGWGPFAFICTMSATLGTPGVSMLANVIPPLACKMMASAYPASYAVSCPRFRKSFTSFFKGQGEAKRD